MDEKTEIVGYHGTTRNSAIEIIDTQKIEDSIGDEEWLGKGKYFYNRPTNALEYIIRKYNNNEEISKPISYTRLMEYYCILILDIRCDKKDILDLDEIVVLSKFVWMWEKIYDKIKDDEEFKKLKFRDGYMIDYMIEEIDEMHQYKIVIKTFDRVIKNKKNRYKSNVIFDETRIVYEIKQKYICVKDGECLSNIDLYNMDYSNAYNDIQKLNKIVNRSENYET